MISMKTPHALMRALLCAVVVSLLAFGSNAEPPATPNTVEFAGQKQSIKAGDDGKWTLKLDPLKANAEPQVMTITSPTLKEPVQVKGILVGEVWIASGQSNMQWLANKCDVGRVLQAGIKARVEAGEELKTFIIIIV